MGKNPPWREALSVRKVRWSVRPSPLQRLERAHSARNPLTARSVGRPSGSQFLTKAWKAGAGDRPLGCKERRKAFRRYSSLPRHKSSHAGGNPCEYKECAKAFRHSSSLEYEKELTVERNPANVRRVEKPSNLVAPYKHKKGLRRGTLWMQTLG